MKKFFVPLFFFLLLSCSSEDFKSDIAASAQKDVDCYVIVEGQCRYQQISKNLCDEIGVLKEQCPEVSSSSSEDEFGSSSSRTNRSSSSRASSSSFGSSSAGNSSSSSVVSGSSSSAGISSSSVAVISSSSVEVSSSSSVAISSSSSVEVSSSSGVEVGSSSSVVVVSSSSVGSSSSISLGAPDIDVTALCASFPYYVARTKKENVSNLFSLSGNIAGCGSISYSPASIANDSISFASYSVSSNAEKDLTITASIKCGNKTYSAECLIKVVVAADSLMEARCNHEGIFVPPLSPFKITKTTTIINYACCEPQKEENKGYYITCGKDYTLKINGSDDITSTDNHANLPILNPMIPEPNAQCIQYGSSPGGVLYRYPKRILMTTSSSNVSGPNGGFTCESW